MKPKHATRMPALFAGHGSPMNALESNRYTQISPSCSSASTAHSRSRITTSWRNVSRHCERGSGHRIRWFQI
jgi:aromatic ring-opening dioxygenase catalytic subunit (LigB family)